MSFSLGGSLTSSFSLVFSLVDSCFTITTVSVWDFNTRRVFNHALYMSSVRPISARKEMAVMNTHCSGFMLWQVMSVIVCISSAERKKENAKAASTKTV